MTIKRTRYLRYKIDKKNGYIIAKDEIMNYDTALLLIDFYELDQLVSLNCQVGISSRGMRTLEILA